MKKVVLSIVVLFTTLTAINAQNVQQLFSTHSLLMGNQTSFIKDIQSTTTVENFKLDKWGSTFYFVDLFYGKNSLTGSYWEIAREFKFWENPVSAHIEYNGGTFAPHAFLVGPSYTYLSKDFNKVVTCMLLYKGTFLKGAYSNGVQFTTVWNVSLLNHAVTMCGFFDLWSNGFNAPTLVSQPQFWYNLNTLEGWDDVNLSLGVELQFVYNLGVSKIFSFTPALATKWTF